MNFCFNTSSSMARRAFGVGGIALSIGIALAQSALGAVVINEVHYNPDVKIEPVEFVELYNAGASAADLSGWQLAGGVDYVFPGGTTLMAGGYLVVAQNPAALQAKFGTTALGPWVGQLDNNGDEVLLKNASGGTEDKVDYQLGFPWPTVGDVPGRSIELLNPLFDNDLGGNWRSSVDLNPPSGEFAEYISSSSIWSYRKGTSEPPVNWMDSDFSTNALWDSGAAPIGYGVGGEATILSDMRGSYSTIYLRRDFVIETAEQLPAAGLLDYYIDDGAIVYLNGVEMTRLYESAGIRAYDSRSGNSVTQPIWESEYLPNLSDYLVVGTNTLAVHLLNSFIFNSDLAFDLQLKETVPPPITPTPGMQNTVYATNAPPKIRQVNHSPKAPMSAQEVVVTAKITDTEGVGPVSLLYQMLEPGSYIEQTDPAYESNWTTLAMNDAGVHGDAMAGDSIYTASLPASLQQHRRLIRYRISAGDGLGESLAVPYSDDPQPNFAYFCYDGVPAWQASVQPGTTPALGFSTNMMRRIPSIHLISKRSEVEEATWFERYLGSEYKWSGALVYDGTVYDHIRYRARGGGWRYSMCKNMWKFDFNWGHDFQMRDDYGRKYDTTWRKLNLGANIQQGTFQHRGEQGLFESVGSRFFNLAGVESFKTTFLQLRIIDEAVEADPTTQYEGDFWGLYLAVEQLDGRFLDEHDLPDGNFYKMQSGTGELNNTGPLGPIDKSDLNYILDNYTDATTDWWRANWDLENYYSYQAVVQGIHHYDINNDKNFFYYHNPETERWKVIPWDLDLTWADNMYNPRWGGRNALADRILGASAANDLLSLTGDARPEFRMEFRNRTREIRDLLFNADQGGQLIDEQANLLRDSVDPSPTILDADRAMWDYNPKMVDSNYVDRIASDKAGIGKFYQWPESGVSHDFNGCVQLMKNYVADRASHLDDLATDFAIPNTPAISYTGEAGHPLNGLSFNCSAFSDPQGTGTFAAMQWRAGEVLDVLAPAYDPTKAPPYEITSKWESGELASYDADLTLPVDALKVGHTYRVRVRMKDDTGRWSHWSAPVEFTTTEASTAGAMISHLRISEVMYDSPDGSDFEFVELHNISTNQTLDLGGAAFTEGIDFNFPGGTTLDPGGYLLVIRNADTSAFRAHYGLDASVPIAGSYEGKLSNDGEELRLKTAPGGSEIAEFDYGSGRTWPLAAAGAGHSLVPVDPSASGQATGALDYPGNWRASTYITGSPGAADPAPLALSVVLNEIAARTDYSNPSKPEYDSNDWIELHNPSSSPVSLDGCYLSDDPADPAKWAIPAISIPAGGYHVFNEVDDFHSPITSGFGLDKAGEQVLLSYLPGTAADRVADAIGFKGQENDRSLSRSPDGTGFWFTTTRSPEIANTAPLPGLRLSEIMYQPPLLGELDNVRDEFIEILNPTASDVTMQTDAEAWRLNGGIEYTFPDHTVLPAGERLLIVSFDPADTATSNAFVAAYSITNTLRIFGPYTGKLGNRSDRATLEKPQLPDAVGEAYSWVIEDEMIYCNQNPWPASAAGTGHSLERISMSQHGLDSANWRATTPGPGSESFDHDGDGMPSNWETTHGLDPDNPADAAVDSDGDGLNNLEEYLSGTNPKDPSSALKIDLISISNETINLGFTAVAEKTYTIQYCPALALCTWQTLTNLGAAVSTEMIHLSDPSSTNSARFYRIKTPATL